MNTNNIETDRELQQILWACYDFWKTSNQPPSDREIYYGWVIDGYKKKFGATFHQAKLHTLVALGYLMDVGTARGGKNRYYRLIDPEQVDTDLKRWGF